MAYAIVQSATTWGNFVTSVTTAGVTTTNGNCVVVDDHYSTAAYTSNTDSNTNSWTSVAVSEITSVGGDSGQCRYNASITGGAAHTFTLTLAGNGFPGIGITEISGLAASPLDVVVSATTPFSTAHTTGATAAVAADTKLALGFAGAGTSATISVTNAPPWTQQYQETTGGLLGAWQAASSGNTYTFDATTSGNDSSCQWVTTWKEPAATGSVKRMLLLGVG